VLSTNLRLYYIPGIGYKVVGSEWVCVLLGLMGVHHECVTKGQVVEVGEDALGYRDARGVWGMSLAWDGGAAETDCLCLIMNTFPVDIILVLKQPDAKIISPVLKLRGAPIGKLLEVMMAMTTLTANHTPPRHPPQTTSTSKPPSTREVLMTPNSNIWCNHNKSFEHSNFLCGGPTKTSYLLPNDAVVNLPVDNDN